MSEKFGKRVCLWTAMAMWMCVASAAGGPATEASRFTILVFTKTAGYRHDSIPAGITAIRSLGNEHGFTVVNSEETSIFNEVELAKYCVIVFLNTTGDILNSVEQAADSPASIRPQIPNMTGPGMGNSSVPISRVIPLYNVRS